MIKIQSVEIDTYKLYKNTTLDLEDRKGLISLEGKNTDNPNFSSNSVGKSTLVSAVLQGLYGKNLTSESIERVSHIYSGAKPKVTINFETKGKSYKVINDYVSNTVKTYENGNLLEFTRKKDIFNEIEDILGISHFLFSNLCYVSPTTNSLFSSSSNDSQSKFIQQLLNIEFITEINKKASADLKAMKGELNLAVKEVTMQQNLIESLQKQLELVPIMEYQDYDALINSLAADISRTEDLKIATKKSYDKIVVEKDKAVKDLIETKSELAHLEKALKKEEDLIKQGKCTACGQDTTHLEIHTDMKAIKRLRKSIEEKTVVEMKVKAELKEVEQELSTITSDMTKKQAELMNYKREQDKQNRAQSSEVIREKLVEQRNEATGALLGSQQSLQDLEKKVYILELISTCTSSKGYIKTRVQQFLTLFNIELHNLAKELLGNEYLVSIVQTKSGHYELIVNDSEIQLNYNSLSSGFKARCDIVLCLALNKAVETLTGISINLLFLDEILSSIDESGVDSVNKMLDKVKFKFPDKIIFVVSHNQKLKSSDGTLLIERADDESKFRWVE